MKKKQYTQLRNAPSVNRERSNSSTNKDVSILLGNHSSNQRLSMNYADESQDYQCSDQKENKPKNRPNSGLSNSSQKKLRSSSGQQMRNRSSNISIPKVSNAYGESRTPLDFTNHKDKNGGENSSSQVKLSNGSSVGRQTADCALKIQNSALGQHPLTSASAGEIKQIRQDDNTNNSRKSVGKKKNLGKHSSMKRMETRQQPPINYTKVFVMGDTRYGQLGFQCSSESSSKRTLHLIEVPRTCSYNILVKSIACGESHSHLLSQDGYVYSMGRNAHGVLGLGKDEDKLRSVTQPQLVPNLQCVIQIASGRVHSVALDVKRDVFAWGRSENGAIGFQKSASSANANEPRLVTINLDQSDRIDQVDCGLEHSCFLTTDGHVFACGEGEYGQLGLGHTTINEHRAARVKFHDLVSGDYVTQVACGAHHTAYLTRRRQVYATGLNNLGQLGIDSHEPQFNKPMLVESLSDKLVSEISAGESTFAITSEGELYAWGLYNLQVYRAPTLVTEIQKPVSSISQSFYGVTAVVDIDEQAWYWYACLDAKAQNLLNLEARPTVVRQLRKRQVRKVFAGKDLIFALGDDITTLATTSLTQKDSTLNSGSGLQEIPEREEQRSSDTTNTHNKMPALNLAKLKLHKNSNQELKLVTEEEVHQNIFDHMPIERNQYQKKNTPSRSHSAAKSHKKSKEIRQSFDRRSTQRRKNAGVRSESYGSKDLTAATRQLQQQPNQLTAKSKSRTSNHIRSRSTNIRPRPSNETQILAKQQRDASLQSTTKSQKMIKVVKRRTGKFEKQVSLKFKDLGRRLETDKEDLILRLTKLTRKVSRISKSKTRKQSKTTKQINSIIDQVEDDEMGAEYDFTSENIITSDNNNISQVKQDVSRTFDNDKQMNIFNQELQEDASTHTKPQLVYSPGGYGSPTVVDIRSPTPHMGEVKNQNVAGSQSPRQPVYQDSGEQQLRYISSNNQDRPQYQGHDGGSDEKISQESIPPPGYINLRSQLSRRVRSPPVGANGFRSPPNKNEMAIIIQLREQIAFLEQQNSRMQDEQKKEQAKVQDYSNRFDDARNQQHQQELSSDGLVRSLESQLRTSKIEKQDLNLKLGNGDRRIRELEEKAMELVAVKHKEEDLAQKLDMSQETVRVERERNKTLQEQNEMLQQTLSMLDTTISELKMDKEVIEHENVRLKEYLEAKDLEIDKEAYNRMLEFQREKYGRSSPEEMDRKSKSLGMRNSTPNLSRKDSPLRKKRFRRDASLAEKSLERSSIRPVSQLSPAPHTNYESSNLISMHPTTGHHSVAGIDPGSQLQGKKGQKPSQHSALVLSKAGTSSDLREKDSKDTGRFVGADQNNDEGDESKEEPMNPKIQRLLKETIILQEKHAVRMSLSPLRLKQSSTDRYGQSANPQKQCCCNSKNEPSQGHSLRETAKNAQVYNYGRTRENSQPRPSPDKIDRRSNSSISAHRPANHSPLRNTNRTGPAPEKIDRRSNSPISDHRPANHSPLRNTYRTGPAPEKIDRRSNSPISDHRPANHSTLRNTYRTGPAPEKIDRRSKSPISDHRPGNHSPLRNTNRAGPPPEKIDRRSYSPISDHRPVNQSPQRNTNRASPPHEKIDRRSKSPISAHRPPNHSPLRNTYRTGRSPRRFSIEDTLTAQQARQHQEYIIKETVAEEKIVVKEDPLKVKHDFNPEQIRVRAGINVQQLGPVVAPVNKHRNSALRDKTRSKERETNRHWAEEPPRSDMDNRNSGYVSQTQDYVNQTREREVLNKHADESIGPIDREKLQEAYNQKLLNQLESFAAQANKPTRVNKFMRSQDHQQHDNNTSLHTSDRGVSPNQGSRKSNLSQSRQQQQMPLPGAIFGQANRSASDKGRNASNRKSSRRQPRALSREDDHDETMNMLVEPKRGNQWNYGMDQGRGNSNEKVTQTAENNSFLARRAALQNRLKNL